MNHNKVNRYYRKPQSNINQDKLCIRCFCIGHRREDGCGSNEPHIACSQCFRMNIFSQNCVCSNCFKTLSQKGMTLRLSDGKCPRPYIDVIFGGRIIPALINTSSYRSSINLEALELINAERRLAELSEFTYPGTLEYKIRRRNRTLTLLFTINATQPQLLKVGMQFLMRSGFALTIDRVTISQRSAVTTNPYTIDFLYNRPQGYQLRQLLKRRKLPMYTEYVEGLLPELQEKPEITVHNEYYNPDAVASEESDGPKIQEDVLSLDADEEDLRMFED